MKVYVVFSGGYLHSGYTNKKLAQEVCDMVNRNSFHHYEIGEIEVEE